MKTIFEEWQERIQKAWERDKQKREVSSKSGIVCPDAYPDEQWILLKTIVDRVEKLEKQNGEDYEAFVNHGEHLRFLLSPLDGQNPKRFCVNDRLSHDERKAIHWLMECVGKRCMRSEEERK